MLSLVCVLSVLVLISLTGVLSVFVPVVLVPFVRVRMVNCGMVLFQMGFGVVFVRFISNFSLSWICLLLFA